MQKSGTHDFSQSRRWSTANSHHIMKAYDKSPVASPPLSRNNSTTSIQSTQSEPAWKSHSDRHGSVASVSRKDSNASTQTTDSHKKGGFMGMFSKEKKPKEKKDIEKIVLGSRHAAAVKTKLMLDPTYRELSHKNPRAGTQTTGANEHGHGHHSTAAEQEARHPHSGPPAMHASTNTPLLTRIESRDEPEYELDEWERQRRDWNEAKEHNMYEIPESPSRHDSKTASPLHSGDLSPERTFSHPKHPSYPSRYHRNQEGRWTKKDSPPATQVHHGTPHPDALVTSLTKKLNAL